MAEWRFLFTDETSEEVPIIKSGITDKLNSGANKKIKKTVERSNSQEFSKSLKDQVAGDTLQNFITSPLNTITGGLASPVVSMFKSGVTAGALGTLAGMAVMLAVEKSIEYIENRIKKNEEMAIQKGNNDNLLIRTGATSTTTYYTSNFWGVKSKTDRS